MNRRPEPASSSPHLRAAPRSASQPAMTRKALDQARSFLSALFMGVRTAQIHDPSNKAFDNAVLTVHRTAEALFAAAGPFSIQFVEDSVFLNGVRLRFEGGSFTSMRMLRTILETRDLGGLELSTNPSFDAVRQLIMLFSPRAAEGEVTAESLARAQIGMLGVQRFADGGQVKVDRRVFAVQCYAKLLLALREQHQRLLDQRATAIELQQPPPRLRAVRVIQDLIELAADRFDFLLRLSANEAGGTPFELLGANTCVLALALGHAAGYSRQELVDLGVAALLAASGGVRADGGARPLTPESFASSLARMMRESAISDSGHLRALLIGEQALLRREPSAPQLHPLTRLLGLALAYVELTQGFATARLHPLDALARLANDTSGRYEPLTVDLLINVLRAYPAGAEVVLESGAHAVVISHAGGSRWDRPLVELLEEPRRTFDLMMREGGRFLDRIVGTAGFMGLEPLGGALHLEEAHLIPAAEAPQDFLAALEGEDVAPESIVPLDPSALIALDGDEGSAPAEATGPAWPHGLDGQAQARRDDDDWVSLADLEALRAELRAAAPPAPSREVDDDAPLELDLELDLSEDGGGRVDAPQRSAPPPRGRR
jgi:hypothetical protein